MKTAAKNGAKSVRSTNDTPQFSIREKSSSKKRSKKTPVESIDSEISVEQEVYDDEEPHLPEFA